MGDNTQLAVQKLLEWHKKNHLHFAWRETRDPYKILVAEVLLKKTTRNQVSGVYEEVVRDYPNAEKLASADLSDLRSLLEPLGMQNIRSELLVRMANYISDRHGGEVPMNVEELRQVPGVGPYTSNAVLCLAQNDPLPMLDTNAIRVVERVFRRISRRSRPRTDPNLWSFVEDLIPSKNARRFNLALLDFANLICTSRSPLCSECTMDDICSFTAPSNGDKD